MNRIDEKFEQLRKRNEKALVGFVTAGDPDPGRSLEIIRTMCRSGVDILELGIPFSDPTADGPVIQRSSTRALKAGMNLSKAFEMIRELRGTCDVPIVAFSYYNPILAYGGAKFYRDALDSGADGVLIVDLPPEESDELTRQWPDRDLALIRLVAPTTPPDRMSAIAQSASGFIYLVSMTGVTGGGEPDLKELSSLTSELRSRCDGIPVCVGFGISLPEHARAVSPLADGVVVGTAFERIIEAHRNDPAVASKVGEAVGALKAAL